jgi:hypothetical protein
MDKVKEQEKTMDNKEVDVSLPSGIKTEVVLSFLGNISQSLTELSNGINQAITSIITEGTKPNEEGESTDGEE